MTGVQTCALPIRSEEHTSELQSHDISYAVFCLKKHREAPLPPCSRRVRGSAAHTPRHQRRRGGGVRGARDAGGTSVVWRGSFRYVFFFLFAAPPRNPPLFPPHTPSAL